MVSKHGIRAFIIISLFALENNAHCLNGLQLVSTDYFNSKKNFIFRQVTLFVPITKTNYIIQHTYISPLYIRNAIIPHLKNDTLVGQ